jgi:pimeloyl-ACP methyl ester carboxylesterase
VAWQTPEIGEQVVDAMATMGPDVLAPALVDQGMTPAAAQASAAAFDDDMARCVLALYRSAVQPAMAELGAELMATPPARGLVFVAPEDTYAGDTRQMIEVAERLGAATVELPGCGHWWMMQRPDLAADALVAHWVAG